MAPPNAFNAKPRGRPEHQAPRDWSEAPDIWREDLTRAVEASLRALRVAVHPAML